MKTKFVLFILLNFLALNSFGQKKPTKAEIDASNIIQYVNTVTDLRNWYLDSSSGAIKNTLSTAQSNIDKIKSNPNVQVFYINCDNVYQANTSLEQAYDKVAKKPISFDEKSDIDTSVNKAREASTTLRIACEALSNYFSKKEFTSDTDQSNYTALTDNYKEASKAFVQAWLYASSLGAEAANKAELVLIKGSPIADFVIPMKTDLFKMNQVLEILNTDEPDIALVNNNLSDLKTSIDKNKDISSKDTSKLSDAYYREVYTTFYRKLNSCQEGASKLANRIENNDIDSSTESLANVTFQTYDDAVSNYNKFISQ